MEQLLVFANEKVVTLGYMLQNFRVWLCQMAWLSTLKGNGKVKDMKVYYALWIGSTKDGFTKITPVAGII